MHSEAVYHPEASVKVASRKDRRPFHQIILWKRYVFIYALSALPADQSHSRFNEWKAHGAHLRLE
jgi:hypothetical protein